MRTPLDTWLIEHVADGAEDDPRYDLRALCRHQVLPRGVDVWLLDFAAVAGLGEQTFRRHDWVVSADTGRRNRSWGAPGGSSNVLKSRRKPSKITGSGLAHGNVNCKLQLN